MANVRLKVSTTQLLERVKEARKKAEIEHAKREADYALGVKAYRQLCIAALREAIKGIQAGDALPSHDYHYKSNAQRYHLEIPVAHKPLSKPDKFDVSSFDKDISLLELTSQDSLTVGTDDFHWSRYL